jgi:hypothetical protein
MARKRIEVTLTPDAHERLATSVAHGHQSARELNRARIFLWAHDGHTDAASATVLGVSHGTISHRRTTYPHQGAQPLLEVFPDAPRGGRPLPCDRTVEAQGTRMACSEPPPGAARGTRHRSAARRVPLDVVDTSSHEK